MFVCTLSGTRRAGVFLPSARVSFFFPHLRRLGYSLLNLSASLRHGRARFSVAMSNLTDTEYWASQRGSRLYYPGEGRRVLATVRIAS